MSNFVSIKSPIQPFKKKIYVSSDKSLSIRFVLLAAQAIGKSKAYNLLDSEDVNSALKCVKKLGVKVLKKKNCVEIIGNGLNGFTYEKDTTIDAGNSGTLARLILGLLVKSKKQIKLIGDKSLSKRDFSRIAIPLSMFGAKIKTNNNSLPIKVCGNKFLRPINYFEKVGSAQVKSFCCLAALNSPGITKIKAKKSRNHTEILFKNLKLPIKIKTKENYDYIEIEGLNHYRGFNYKIPGDISSAGFFIVLTLLSKKSQIIIKNVNLNDRRSGIIKILNKMNGKIKLLNKRTYKGELISDIKIKSQNNFKSINCNSNLNSSAIDEFLIIFLVAAKAKGISKFKNLGELDKKESPRLKIASNFLKMIGIKNKLEKDNLKIYGNPKLELKNKYEIKNYVKDHRVFAMSCVAALTLGGKWKIHDKDSINTSFPLFLRKLKSLGAKIN